MPPPGIARLTFEAPQHGLIAFCVKVRLHVLPYLDELLCLTGSLLVVVAERLPEGVPIGHEVVPGDVVEPEEEVLGTGVEVVVERTERFGVLLRVAGTTAAAVEANTLLVSTMVVAGQPVLTGTLRSVPGFGTVVMATGKDVVQAQRHHVASHRLARVEEEGRHGVEETGIGGERLHEELTGYLLGTQALVPGQASEGVPVGLCQVVATPVEVIPDVGHTSQQARVLLVPCGYESHLAEMEELLPHGSQEAGVDAVSRIFLCNLELRHDARVPHAQQQRADGLAGLEVDGTVLDLDGHVGAELAVQGHELLPGLAGAILAARGIDEGTPHDDAAVGSQGIGQHVGTIHMGASIVHGARFPLAVGLDEESSEVWDEAVERIHLVLPPAYDGRVEWVGGGEAANGLG